jgi:tRNA pseudouridine55 synthase
MNEGIVIINKPNGLTSHDVVMKVRNKLGLRRVGHAGTLDPLATGVLVMLLGKSTKLFNEFVTFDKAYQATLILGTSTDSADIHGKIIQHLPYEQVTQKQVENVFKKFVGEIEQIPPMVSAIKIGGKKLYKLARKGIGVQRHPRKIKIHCLRLQEFKAPEVKFFIECSKGTYVRQVAEDVGKALGCGACISQIERTMVGTFSIEDAVNLEDFNESHIRHWEG